MKLLYLAMDYPPLVTPGVWRTLAMSKYLALKGHSIRLICANKTGWQSGVNVELLHATPSSVQVIRLWNIAQSDIVPRLKRAAKFLNRIFSPSKRLTDALLWRFGALYPDPHLIWGLFALAVGLFEVLRCRPGVIVATGPPHITLIVGYLLSRLTGVPLVLEYRDLWNDDPRLCYNRGYRAELMRKLEDRAINRASALVTVSPRWVETLKKRLGPGASVDVCLIRNGQDLSFDEVEDIYMGIDKPAAEKSLRLHFHGSLYETPELFLQAIFGWFDDNNEARERVKLSFMAMPKDMKLLIDSSMYADNFLEVGLLEHREGLRYCLESQVLLLIKLSGNSANLGTIPGKSYEYLALGKPIVCLSEPGCDLNDLMAGRDNTFICDGNDKLSIRQCLESMFGDYLSGSLSEKALDESEFYRYSRRSQAEQMESVCNRVINEQD